MAYAGSRKEPAGGGVEFGEGGEEEESHKAVVNISRNTLLVYEQCLNAQMFFQGEHFINPGWK